jgi:hypothetical protein
MRAHDAVAIIGLTFIGYSTHPSAQTLQVPVCPSLALAQQAQQARGNPLPSGCRMVGVRRVDTPTGTVCAVDFSENGQGLFADILDSTVQTRWWTACSNLGPP